MTSGSFRCMKNFWEANKVLAATASSVSRVTDPCASIALNNGGALRMVSNLTNRIILFVFLIFVCVFCLELSFSNLAQLMRSKTFLIKTILMQILYLRLKKRTLKAGCLDGSLDDVLKSESTSCCFIYLRHQKCAYPCTHFPHPNCALVTLEISLDCGPHSALLCLFAQSGVIF